MTEIWEIIVCNPDIIIDKEHVKDEEVFEILVHQVMKGDPGRGTTDFNFLDHRPKYNGVPMTGATDIITPQEIEFATDEEIDSLFK